jgi:hypothetical protein
MSNRAELVVDKAEAALDEMVRKNSMIGATEILMAFSQAGLVLVDRSDPYWRLVIEAVEPSKKAGSLPKCLVCGGLGISATVEQFENAYKRH